MIQINNKTIQLNTKTKILIFLICIVALVSTVNTTYSRYVSAASGTVTTNLARWQLFINSENITNNYGTSMTFTPTILPNSNVAANKIAPSSKGYFDIAINPTNVDVSFTYDISINIPEDSLITDIKVTDYIIVEGTEILDDSGITKESLKTNSLNNTLLYDNTQAEFSFKPFVIRMYFSWIDDENETMNDAADANIGNMIANGEDTKFELGVNISFKQYVGEETVEDNTNNEDVPSDNGDESLEEEPENPENPENTDTTENLDNPDSIPNDNPDDENLEPELP